MLHIMPYLRHKDLIQWLSESLYLNEKFYRPKGFQTKNPFFPRGTILMAKYGENIGFEKSGYRPVLIVSNDQINKSNKNVLVVPLTKSANKRTQQGDVRLSRSQYLLHKKNNPFLTFDSVVQCEDIRSISKYRLRQSMGNINPGDLQNIRARLKFTVGI